MTNRIPNTYPNTSLNISRSFQNIIKHLRKHPKTIKSLSCNIQHISENISKSYDTIIINHRDSLIRCSKSLQKSSSGAPFQHAFGPWSLSGDALPWCPSWAGYLKSVKQMLIWASSLGSHLGFIL